MANSASQTPGAACPYCGASPARFLHDGTRPRKSRGVEQGLVSQTPEIVTRWKCPACRRSFTEYPESVVPGKHFSRESIYKLCERYLSDGSMTYRDAVCEDGIPIAYPESDHHTSEAGDDDDAQTPILSHTTLYRWITTLGGKQPPPDASVKEAKTTQSRDRLEDKEIDERKYRSAARRDTLKRCWKVVRRRDGTE